MSKTMEVLNFLREHTASSYFREVDKAIAEFEQLQAELERLNNWIDQLESAATLENDTIRIKKFKVIREGKTLEQALKE